MLLCDLSTAQAILQWIVKGINLKSRQANSLVYTNFSPLSCDTTLIWT